MQHKSEKEQVITLKKTTTQNIARKQKLIIHSFFLKQPSWLSKKTTMMHIAQQEFFVLIIETLSVLQALIPGLFENPPWESF